MKQKYYSNGKLLITAEYVVLDGAKALALPTKFGQTLEISTTNSNHVSWKSYDFDQSIWFETVIDFDEIKTNKTNNTNAVHVKLIEILHQAHELNHIILSKNTGFEVITTLTFPRKWGLGTSSTLINNIAQWFQVDAFELLNLSFGGSGYDIACAQNNFPILYELQNSKPIVSRVAFQPSFSNNIYFVYLNQKQNSNKAIEMYRQKEFDVFATVLNLNDITNSILKTTNTFDIFCELIQNHEAILSKILQTQTIQEQLFSDFDGVIKSLGAWGGDFVLVASKQNPTAYFLSKGFDVIIGFDKMIL